MSADLWEFLGPTRREHAGRIALRTQQGDFEFEALFAAAEALARDLSHSGVRPGEIVALTLPNGPTFVAATLALFRLGTPAALVSPRYSASELGMVANVGGLSGFLTSTAYSSRIAEMLGAGR